jgi:probable rRNA maturation factor
MKFEIRIFNDTDYKPIPRAKMRKTMERVLLGERWKTQPIEEASINVALVCDDAIHAINKEFLKHDYPTDIITFSLEEDRIDGELYISIDTALRQSAEYGVSLTNELMRLVAHGVLHLVGYDDHDDEARARMTELENYYMNSYIQA